MNQEMETKRENEAPGMLTAQSALARRELYLWGAITDESARPLIQQIHHLAHEGPGQAITIYLNCPGGATHAGFAILDAMDASGCTIRTICMGMAASFGALVLMRGTAGERYVTRYSRVMIHQPHITGQYQAVPADVRIFAENMSREKREIANVIAAATGQSLERVEEDIDRDTWFRGEEAVRYGMADAIWSGATRVD